MDSNAGLTPSRPTSRRALLAGALGGLGAFVASTIGRATEVHATNGDTITVGGAFTGTSSTWISNVAGGDGMHSVSSGAGIGLYGESSSYLGLSGFSSSGTGTAGTSSASDKPAVLGQSWGSSTGVQGWSNLGSGSAPPAAPAKTGVYGYAAQDTVSVGVRGESPAGLAVYGKTSTGYAGYFNGKVFSSQFLELAEIVTPAAPGGNRGRLFMRDNGAGKTQLCVKFPTGGTVVLATQP